MAEMTWDEIEVCYKLGARLKEEGDLAGAESCFRRILDLDPELPDTQHALGVVLQLMGKLREAVVHYQAAIALDPLLVTARYNLADACSRLGLFQEAIEAATATLQCDPDHAEAHWLLGMLLLRNGDFRNGWREYEWRWKAHGFTSTMPDFDRPLWDGSPLVGRTLLIHMEQGRGDMIQFVRFVPMAAARGGTVVVSALRELVPLLATVEGVARVVDRDGPLPSFDFHLPVQSLPYVLGITLDTIPHRVPYLWPDTEMVAVWKEMLGDQNYRVGLVWQGTPSHLDDQNRSCPLSVFRPLGEMEGVTFYSLQIGTGGEQLAEACTYLPLVDVTSRIHNFSDTAAMVANLDLVISVDTAVAHLAGALGKPVWLMLPYVSEWRWLQNRDDSPWYPTMRLFRQSSPGDWGELLVRVKQELAQQLPAATLNNQSGIELMRQGRYAEAEGAFFSTLRLNPASADAHCNRGVALDALERYEEALDSYRQALSLRPDFVQALFNMGNTYRSLRNPENARVCYQRVVDMVPDFLAAYLCLGEIAKEQRNFDEARHHFEKALARDPECVNAVQGIAEILQATEDFQGAVEAYRQVLALDPHRPTAWNMLGTTYHCLEKLAEAEASYRQAAVLDPDRPTILNNLGAVLHAQGDPQGAAAVFSSIIEKSPDNAEAHWNLALALLALGQYREGWQEYEWRFRKVDPVPAREYPQPRWDGSPLRGRTVLLWCEQGFGDTIQFSRYVPLVAQLGGRVVLECQVPALKRLLCSLAGVAEVVVTGATLPPFDCHVPLLSLPLLSGTTLENIPAGAPYLHVEQAGIELWRQRLGPAAGYRVGLVWFGRQGQVLNRKRSCPLEMLSPLAIIPNLELYSLQVGEGAEQLDNNDIPLKIIDLTEHIHDFADTAAFMANLDLVITIDTAVAHLAGAVGVPTWALLPYSADWRWLLHRSDSPWYPAMRLFRQSAVGDWSSVVNAITDLLGKALREGDFIRESSAQSSTIQVADDWRCGAPRDAINDPSAVMRVGLAWSGRQDNPLNRKRTCSLSVLAPLLELPGVDFYSLQLGVENDRRACGSNLIDLTGNIRDFEDTAALIANLDLVITIDTAVAHLAGALGRSTWVLLPHVADWRWLLSREDNPWYPGMRLFRQPDYGDWDSVIRRVVVALACLTGKRSVTGIPEVSSPLCPEPLPERLSLEHLLEHHQKKLTENSSNPATQLDVGAALALLGRHEESISYFRAALVLAPELVAAHLNLAYALLTLGEYREGWEHFEWRLRRVVPGQIPPWPMLGREEFGMHPRGTSVLVHCEQGFGDTIQFTRFLPMLADAGYRVVVSCHPTLATLVKSVSGVNQVVSHGQLLPMCDLQLLLLSLPRLFATTLETIPADLPYLLPTPQLVAEWRSSLFNPDKFS